MCAPSPPITAPDPVLLKRYALETRLKNGASWFFWIAALSLVKTVLSLALAILLAWIVARTDTPGRGALEILITLPFFIPPILTATAWAMLGRPIRATLATVARLTTKSTVTASFSPAIESVAVSPVSSSSATS